jgi:hypothetical protein
VRPLGRHQDRQSSTIAQPVLARSIRRPTPGIGCRSQPRVVSGNFAAAETADPSEQTPWLASQDLIGDFPLF